MYAYGDWWWDHFQVNVVSFSDLTQLITIRKSATGKPKSVQIHTPVQQCLSEMMWTIYCLLSDDVVIAYLDGDLEFAL